MRWATTLVVLLLLATGCSGQPGDHYADATDVARAERVWADPWAAPRPELPEAGYGSNGLVSREAGSRETSYDGVDAVRAARLEVDAAVAAGWSLTGAECAPDEVRLVLTRGTEDLDTTAAAGVTVTGSAEVRVEVAVPHHADGSWPDLGSPVRPADSCLGGGGAVPLPDVPYDGSPIDAAGADQDPPRWEETDPGDEALRARVADDAWFRSTGAELSVGEPATGDRRRSAPAAEGSLTQPAADARTALAVVVGDLTAGGWETTWVSCGAQAPADATLRLVVDGRPATVRLTAAATGTVSWQLTLPVTDGPDPAWVLDPPALRTPACLGAEPLPRGLVHEGTPVGLPRRLQPISR